MRTMSHPNSHHGASALKLQGTQEAFSAGSPTPTTPELSSAFCERCRDTGIIKLRCEIGLCSDSWCECKAGERLERKIAAIVKLNHSRSQKNERRTSPHTLSDSLHEANIERD
jgi:hypothetical protein